MLRVNLDYVNTTYNASVELPHGQYTRSLTGTSFLVQSGFFNQSEIVLLPHSLIRRASSGAHTRTLHCWFPFHLSLIMVYLTYRRQASRRAKASGARYLHSEDAAIGHSCQDPMTSTGCFNMPEILYHYAGDVAIMDSINRTITVSRQRGTGSLRDLQN